MQRGRPASAAGAAGWLHFSGDSHAGDRVTDGHVRRQVQPAASGDGDGQLPWVLLGLVHHQGGCRRRLL